MLRPPDARVKGETMKFKVGDCVKIVNLPDWDKTYANYYLGQKGIVLAITLNCIKTNIPLVPEAEGNSYSTKDPNWTVWFEEELELVDGF